MVPIMTAVAPSTTHTEMTTVGREEEAGEESLTSAHWRHAYLASSPLTDEKFVFSVWGDIGTASTHGVGGPRSGGGRVGEGGSSVGAT